VKALTLVKAGQVELVESPRPDPGPDESLVRVAAVGLCGSDLHWFSEGGIGDAVLHRPLVLGHEFGGTVEGGPLHGRRVAVDPAIPCEKCDQCRQGNHNLCPQVRFAGHGTTDGGLQEYVSWPTHLLFPVPDSFDDPTVALLEPLGVALHAFDLGHVRFAASVAVVGCGPIGLMTCQVARAAGASFILAVEPLRHRREAALACGADVALAPDEAPDNPHRADVVFDMCGNADAVSTAVVLARPGARVVLAGIPDDDRTTFPAAVARRKGITFPVVRRMKDAYPRAIDVVHRKVIDVGPLVSHTFPVTDAAAAFRTAVSRQGLKTVISVN
jgi:L-iditol 2-dehydrogenase